MILVLMQRVMKLFENHQSSRISSMNIFSILAGIFERFLGDSFLFMCHGKLPIPNLLRDLLETSQLTDLFGGQICWYLKGIIGPATGMNLRNIIWHGFISPDQEFEISYTSFLFVLFFTCLDLVSNHKAFIEFKPRKPSIPGKEVSFDFGCGTSPFESLDGLVEKVKSILPTSYFIYPDRVDVIIQAYQFFVDGFYFESLCLVLPQLEHCCRRIFVYLHDHLPEEMLFSQSRVLFTTMEEILVLYHEDARIHNMIIKEFGDNVFSCLNDIFIHGDGMRTRDKIAHGEVDSVDFNAANKIFGILTYLIVHYNLRKGIKEFDHTIKYFQCYQSIYHPRSCFVREMFDVFDHWTNLPISTDIQVREENEITCIWEFKAYYCMKKVDSIKNEVTSLKMLQNLQSLPSKTGFFFESDKKIDNPILYFLNHGYKVENFSTDSVERKEEFLLISMHRKIVNELLITTSNIILKKDQLEKMIQDHTARSPHRKGFVTLKECLPLLKFIVMWISKGVEYDFISICHGNRPDFVKSHKGLSKMLTLCQRIQQDIMEGNIGGAVHRFAKELNLLK